MSDQDLFLQIRAIVHALDALIVEHSADNIPEDIEVLSMMLVDLIDEYDTCRKAEALQ